VEVGDSNKSKLEKANDPLTSNDEPQTIRDNVDEVQLMPADVEDTISTAIFEEESEKTSEASEEVNSQPAVKGNYVKKLIANLQKFQIVLCRVLAF